MRICPLLLSTPLCLLLTACYSYMLVRPGSLKPATGMIAPDRRIEVWQRALTVLLDAGYMPDLLNEGACFIKARQREDLVPDATNRTTAVITVGSDGVLRVEVAGSGYYRNEGELAADIAKKQNFLLRGILDAAAAPPKAHTP